MTADERYDLLRRAGEQLWMLIVSTPCTFCGNCDPRHPRNAGCSECQSRGATLTAWDEALVDGAVQVVS